MLNASLLDIPRPFLDPIDSLVEALGVACLAIERPLTPGALALVTDAQRRGLGIVRLCELTASSIHSVVGQCAHIPDAHSLVLVSIRTSEPISPVDPELLQHFSTVIASAGLSLYDWVVVGRGGIYCPRSLTDISDPWPASVACL